MATTLTACIDGLVVDPAQAMIPATDDGLLRGDGVFEVIRIYGGRPFCLDKHLDRLEASAGAIGLGVDRAALESDAAKALTDSGPRDAALRLVWTRGGHRVVLVEELPAYPGPAALASIGHETNPILEGVKSLSYAANMQATRMAQTLGADEALFVREDGTILEAPTAAIFWVAESRLRTPALDGGILASITRRIVIEALDVEEGNYKLFDLQGANEAFLASTTREVQPVASVDGTSLPVIGGEWTDRAAGVVRAAVEAELSG